MPELDRSSSILPNAHLRRHAAASNTSAKIDLPPQFLPKRLPLQLLLGPQPRPLPAPSLWPYSPRNRLRRRSRPRTKNSFGRDRAMTIVPVSRRTFIKSSTAVTAGLVLSPAIIGRAEAATLKLKCSSSLPNDPKFANGRVYYDNLVKQVKANGLGEQVEVAFFPDNQLGQEIDVINSVKLGVIDLMVSGSSISANLVPLVGTYDLGYLFSSFPQQTKAFDAGAAKPIEEALLKGANIRIVAWAYNFGSRSVLAKKPVKGPEDLAGLKIRTLPNPVITECLRLMGAAATPLAFGEIYTALQAGVLDGLEHDPPTILASKFYETSKHYALTQHNFSPLATYFSEATFARMDGKLRDGFLDAAKKAAADSRTHGLAVEKEALAALADKGVIIFECDKEAFRKRVLPQTDNFIKARPEAKAVIDAIRATQA